jgi:hypothetical protein
VREVSSEAIDTTFGVSVEIEGQQKPALVADWISRHYLGEKA